MKFSFPKKKINDTCWFLSETDVLIFGMVKLITIAINEDECKTYYRLIDEAGREHTACEDQVIDNQVIIPTPKYTVGDGVVYTVPIEGGTHAQCADIIKSVEISMYEKGVIEITYTMENNEDEWVLEEEILSFGENVIDITKTNESEYDYCGMSRADV